MCMYNIFQCPCGRLFGVRTETCADPNPKVGFCRFHALGVGRGQPGAECGKCWLQSVGGGSEVTPRRTRQSSRTSEDESSGSRVIYTPETLNSEDSRTVPPSRSVYESDVSTPVSSSAYEDISSPPYVVTEANEMQSESILLCSILGEGQPYIRPGFFYELFNPERGDTAAVRYQTIVEQCRHHLGPLDYEPPSAFISRMHSIRLEKDIPKKKLPLAAIQAAYLDWAITSSNWPFLRQEEDPNMKPSIVFGGQLGKWPPQILDILNSPKPLVDEKGYFVAPPSWLDEETTPPDNSLEYSPTVRYQFALLMARKDPNVLPHEGRKEYLVRQLESCKSSKLLAELNARYDAWFEAPENLPLLPFRFGDRGYDTRDMRYLTVRKDENFWDRDS